MASGTLKEADADRIVREIAKAGIPSMIASDVNPAPAFVLKIAARFNVRAFVPPRSMQTGEKMEIAEHMATVHERDALAAAVKCYRFYANRLRQIGLMETGLDRDRLMHLVLQGYSLKNAVLMLERRAESQGGREGGSRGAKERRDDELLALAEENANLRKALEAERMANEALAQEIRKVKGARYAEIGKDAEVRRLRARMEKLSWMLRRSRRRG